MAIMALRRWRCAIFTRGPAPQTDGGSPMLHAMFRRDGELDADGRATRRCRALDATLKAA